uniref:Pre-mRNA processing factor 4 (PRP4)-like domain-containing protein n=1 Tax=Acrobeloides nanus TaxID=290746 RepID=A0A914C989_9BILA
MEVDEPVVKKQKVVHGSLADRSTVEKILKNKAEADATRERVQTFDMKSIDNPHEKAVLAEFDRRRFAKKLNLPTDDIQVKLKLRRCNAPICLFGEDILDRRERLRTILSKLSEDEIFAVLHSDDRDKDSQQQQQDTVTCLRRAELRLQKAREQAQRSAQEKALVKQETAKYIQSLAIYGSQAAGTRAVSFCEFSPDSKQIITGSWDGQCSLWSMPDMNQLRRFNGHAGQLGCARFHPGAYTSIEPEAINAASCDSDGRVLLWSLASDQPFAELDKHDARVARLAFHQTGRFLATCCFDASWRLFDLERLDEILFQEGHSKAVFDIDFQPDGSLALSGGLDCYGRVWDLRTGRCIMFLEGHQKALHTVGWHPNGFIMATGSADNTVKIWDVRMRRCIYTIAAHQSLVSRLKIDSTGEYMVTGSFDHSVRIWTTTGWQPLKVLEGHDMKVMGVDVSPDGKWIASSSADRTVKLWAKSDM